MSYAYIVDSAIYRKCEGITGLLAYSPNEADRSETASIIISVGTLKM